MADELSHIVKGYYDLAEDLVKRWGALAAEVTRKVDSGKYDADAAMADVAAAVRLAGQTGFQVAGEALDAAAVLSARQDDAHIEESPPFTSPLAGARLELDGPLGTISGSDTLPLDAVWLLPSAQLAPGAKEFRLRANGKGRRGALYRGQVTATEGGHQQTVDVFIQIA